MSPDSPEYQTDLSVRYGRWLIRWRWGVIALSLIVAGGTLAGGQYLRMETAYRVFFGKENPQLRAFDGVQNIYTKNDNVLFVVAPDDGEVFTTKTLAAVEALAADAWKLPYAIRVDAVTNFQHTRAEADDLIVADLIESAERLSADEIAYAKRVAVNDPRLVNFLIPKAANVTGVNVTLQLPELDPRENEIAAAAARSLVSQIEEAHPGVQIYLTGFAMLNNAFQEASMKDMATLTPLMYLIIFVTMGFLLRSVTGTLSTGLVIVLSAGCGMGLAGWLDIPITPPSSAAPTVIMTLAVADSIHVLVTMLQQMRYGLDKRDAIVESLRLNLQPVFLTSLTTIVGFLSMNFSDVPPLRDLGNITSMGVAAAFLFSVSLLPAMMAVLPVRVKLQSTSQTVMLDRFADWVVGRRRPLLWGATAVVVALAVFVPQNDLNDQFVKYFDDSIAFRRDTDFAMKHLSGIYQIEYSIESGRSQGISDPAYLERIDAFSDWFKTQPGVVHVNTISETMKRLNMNMHGDDPAHMKLPENPELSAQYLLLYEMSLPYGLDLNNQINVDKSATRVVVTAENVTTKDLRKLVEGGEAWLRENAPPPMHAAGVGPAVMFSYISERNIRSMLVGTLVAFFIISGVLVIALRSFKFGALSIIPNVAPALLAFGVWGIVVSQVNLGLSIVVGMTLGIVVDDTVHYLSKYLRARREQGLDSEGAVRYAFSTVGTALIVTSLILVAGFAVLSQSSFGFNAGMGQMTALTVAFALLADFTLLPAVLMALESKREAAEVEDEDTDFDDDPGVVPETA